jgi:TonB family protein
MGELMTARPTGSNQGDALLWIAGGAIAVLGAAWLFITQPWGGGQEPPAVTGPVLSATPVPNAAAAPITPIAEPAASLDNPLRMAALAYDAGMLVEPEEYSAWTLYGRALKAEPTNADAHAGLTKVADDLVRRGETALDQGRFDDARATVDRIRAALPEHPGATALAAKIWPQSAPIAPERETPTLPEPDRRVARVTTATAPAVPKVDPLVEAGAAFDAALAAGRLLTPMEQSAKHYLGVLNRANADHELAQRARAGLSQEFLSRAAGAIETLDPEAAGIWIDEAEAILGVTDGGVRAARAALTEQLIAMESTKPVPASALKIATYVAPVYPQRAHERNLEGWVDIEFTVGIDGKTRNVIVTEASHETLFRREATAAVEGWHFEPRVFLGRTIEQTSYTRIRFVR